MNIRKLKIVAYDIHFLLKNYKGDQIYKEIENLQTVRVQTGERPGTEGVMTFITSNHIGESNVFMTSSLIM